MKIKLTAIAAMVASSLSIVATEPTNQELLELLKKQQAQIEALIKKVEASEQKVEATIDVVESTMSQQSTSNSSFGGYGEMHYNNFEDKKTLDLHRFVLFFGHDFNDSTRFFSELEVEHAFIQGGEGGEVAIEQAYIEHDLSDTTSLKVGMFLVPVGLMNETHEPPTFYGVERNLIEKNIIPTTWREGGVNLTIKPQQGLAFDLGVSSGLYVDSSYKIRGGRQQLFKANADSLAYTGRVKYSATPGLELAATLQYQTDITQGAEGVSATLIEAHAVYQNEAFTLKALYAGWDVDSDDAKALGRDEQTGYYIEPSYKMNEKLGFFARFGAYDNEAGISADTEIKQTNVGLNYWLHENVVVKFDIESVSGAKDGNGFNLGMGYMF